MNGATPNIIQGVLLRNRYPYLLVFAGILLLPLLSACTQAGDPPFKMLHGAIVRGDTSSSTLALVFTGDEFADGGDHIVRVLSDQQIRASFFLTGKFYRNPEFKELVHILAEKGHYLGAHSDQHLLYCSWEDRDSLLVTRSEYQEDLLNNYHAMAAFGIEKEEATFFLPPYEWYNDSIASWTEDLGFVLINYTAGTLSHTDYTMPGSRAYRSSREIYASILDHESSSKWGLNGFILLVHIGTAPERTDKFYLHLDNLITQLKDRGYVFEPIDELLKP
jgi:peptidoglycan/xylan/chitin deacetylase (PgdA/CDA1 family)